MDDLTGLGCGARLEEFEPIPVSGLKSRVSSFRFSIFPLFQSPDLSPFRFFRGLTLHAERLPLNASVRRPRQFQRQGG